VISTGVGEFLSVPWVAGLLGFVLGVAIITPLLVTVRLYDEGSPGTAWGIAGLSILGGLVVAIGVMFLYHSIAPEAFPTFGMSVVAGFFVAFVTGAVLILRRPA
jgi:zinc transporter ZupT